MEIKTLSIIIPALNEGPTIYKIIDKIKAVKLINHIVKETIIVDYCSTENIANSIENYIKKKSDLAIYYKKHIVNMLKGAALHTGIKAGKGEKIVIKDIDLEYDPQENNILLKPTIDGFADVVFGSRFMVGNPHRILYFWHSIRNKILTFLTNMTTNLNLTDMETCYKMFRSDVLKSLSLTEKRFGFEPEVSAKISRISKIRIYEVGISYYGRTFEEGKKIN